MESKWADDLKPSAGPKARREQEIAAGVEPTNPEVTEEAKDLADKYKVGDFIRAVYTEDNLEYEGKIGSIDSVEEDGKKQYYANVVFLGYLNEQTVWFDDLLPTQGKSLLATHTL